MPKRTFKEVAAPSFVTVHEGAVVVKELEMAEKDADTSKEPRSLEFHFIKSRHFRVIHVDGGLGGITPPGLCHIALYNERAAIPRMTVREVGEGGILGKELIEDVRGGDANGAIVREVEVDLLFNHRTAVEIRDWLNERIAEFEQIRDELKKEED